MLDNLESTAIEQQKDICKRYGAEFLISPFDSVIGIALDSFKDLTMPINGLRHSLENKESTGWFIWAGEYSSDDAFFKPVHVKHLLEICPKAIQYLGLAPGWRFLFDNNYEDVWYDLSILF